jgi:hypothetical protein
MHRNASSYDASDLEGNLFHIIYLAFLHFRVSEETTRRLLHWWWLLPADSQCIVPRRIAIRPDSGLSA